MSKISKNILFTAVACTLSSSPMLAFDCGGWNDDIVLSKASISDVQTCLNSVGDQSLLNDLGRTPLMSAVIAGRADIVEILLAAGADVNAPGAYDYTALHMAFGPNSTEITKHLLDAGANVNARDGDQKTPLHHVAEVDFELKVLPLFLAKGADASAQDKWGYTALHKAVSRNPNVQAILLLVGAGGDMNLILEDGSSYLHWAARQGISPEQLAVMFDAGVDASLKDNDGRTAADYAASRPNFEAHEVYSQLRSAEQ